MSDFERKLASVRRIAAIDPIEGADKIVCVTVDGWKLVSNKENGFKVNDLVIYFEIDSFLPIREEFEWMRDRCYKNIPGLGEGFRVKTIKLRGQVSQGIIVGMSDFCELHNGQWYILNDDGISLTVDEGSDLTDFLGVRKYEKPIPINMQGRSKGNFPSFIKKTDEDRAQNCWGGIKNWILYDKPVVTEVTNPDMFRDISDLWDDPVFQAKTAGRFFKSGEQIFEKTMVPNSPDVVEQRSQFEATLKLDGSSITIYQYDGKFGVCSRNLELQRDPNNPFWQAAISSGLLAYLAQTGDNYAVQGELMGPGVQGNRESLSELFIYVFNVFDIDKQQYLLPAARDTWMDGLDLSYGDYNLHKVPCLNWIIKFDGKEDINYFLEIADNTKSLYNPIAEGIVFKSHVEGGPSFKIISNKYLLKEAD